MGMLDTYTKLATAQAVTATGDTASTNVYDAGSAAASDIGTADHLYLNVNCDTAATSSGAATLTPVLQHSDDNSTFADALVGPTIALSGLTAGASLWKAKFPLGLKRYTRVVFRVGTAALTAGAFSAFYSMGVEHNVARPSGFTVA
jgi:hypothetical protein